MGGILVSGAEEKNIQLWKIIHIKNDLLIKHMGSVSNDYQEFNINCVRFSPCGRYLASGANRGEVIIWTFQLPLENTKKVKWSSKNIFGLPKDDIMDLCWSTDGSFIAIASINNFTTIHNITSSNLIVTWIEHNNYVQGLAWDPLDLFLASQSCDGLSRIYSKKLIKKKIFKYLKNKKKFSRKKNFDFGDNLNLIKKQLLLFSYLNKENMKKKWYFFTDNSMFYDENGPMFRRLSWSPYGSFLAVPTGIYPCRRYSSMNPELSTTYLFFRNDLNNPISQLPALTSATSVTKWCPLYFRNRLNKSNRHVSNLPYRMYLAISDIDTIFVYDNESIQCIAFIGGLHLASITDLAWSHNGKFLSAGSRDGFCSVIYFEEGELGEPLFENLQ